MCGPSPRSGFDGELHSGGDGEDDVLAGFEEALEEPSDFLP
jgi:hypothetical protein